MPVLQVMRLYHKMTVVVKACNGILNGYPKIKKPENITDYSYQLSALLAMMETAGKMQLSGMLMQQYEKIFLDSCRKAGFSDNLIAHSKKYATNINEQILTYAKADRYNKISDYPRYTPKKEMAIGIRPHRPFFRQ